MGGTVLSDIWIPSGLIKPFAISPQRLSPWVGLRKINVSYWGWEDMSPFTNSSLRWLPGEPSDSGFCAYLEEPQVSGLRANPCTATAHGLICEKATGERHTHGFLYAASVWKNVDMTQELRSDLTHCAFLPVQETPIRVPVHPVRSLARCTPPAPTAPARPWNVCGVAARSVVSTPLRMSSLSLMASVLSGRLETVWVSFSLYEALLYSLAL